MRWGLLSALAALFRRFWPANIASATLFALSHVPAALRMGIPLRRVS